MPRPAAPAWACCKTAREKIASLVAIIARRDASLNLRRSAGMMAVDLPLTREEMQAAVEDAAAKIKSGEIVVHDYMTDDTCPAASF